MKLVTYEECMEAVKQDGGALEDVPKDHRTFEMCLEALKEDSDAIDFIDLNKFSKDEILSMLGLAER